MSDSSQELRYNYDTLMSASRTLGQISKDFGDAGRKADEVAKLVGDSGTAIDLSRAIRSFADAWDDKRAKLMERIDSLAEVTKGVAETFNEVDTKLAQALESDSSSS